MLLMICQPMVRGARHTPLSGGGRPAFTYDTQTYATKQVLKYCLHNYSRGKDNWNLI